MLRIFLFTLAVLFAAVTGLIARRLYIDQTATQGVAAFHVGGQLVTVDRAMLRNQDLRDGGAVNRLDLALTWPDFRPAGTNIGEAGRSFVFLALEDAATRTRSPDDIDPAERPMMLYARFLAPDIVAGPDDLAMRQFLPGTPYEGEDLYVSTPDDRTFAARCPRSAPGRPIEDLCLWQTRLSGLEVHVRFPRRILANWVRIVEGVRGLIPQIAQRPAR